MKNKGTNKKENLQKTNSKMTCKSNYISNRIKCERSAGQKVSEVLAALKSTADSLGCWASIEHSMWCLQNPFSHEHREHSPGQTMCQAIKQVSRMAVIKMTVTIVGKDKKKRTQIHGGNVKWHKQFGSFLQSLT